MKNTKEKGIWIDKFRFTICYFGAARDNYEVRNEDYGFCCFVGDKALRRAQDGETSGVVFWESVRELGCPLVIQRKGCLQ